MGAWFSSEELPPNCNISNERLSRSCNYVTGTGDETSNNTCPEDSFYVGENQCLDHLNGCNESVNSALDEICKFGDNNICENGKFFYDNSCNNSAKVFPCTINEDCSGNASSVNGQKGDCSCVCNDGWEGGDCGSVVPISHMADERHASFDESAEQPTWRCNADFYMSSDKSHCIPCPGSGKTHQWGATGVHECICPDNHDYIEVDPVTNAGTCTRCPGEKVLKLSNRTGHPETDCGCDESNNIFETENGSCYPCPHFAEYVGVSEGSTSPCDCIDGYRRAQQRGDSFICENNCINECGIFKLNGSEVTNEFVNPNFNNNLPSRLNWLISDDVAEGGIKGMDVYTPSYFSGIVSSNGCRCQFGVSNNKRDCGQEGWNPDCSSCEPGYQLVHEGGIFKCKRDGCSDTGYEINQPLGPDPMVCFSDGRDIFTDAQNQQIRNLNPAPSD